MQGEVTRVPLHARTLDAFRDITTRGEARGVGRAPPTRVDGSKPAQVQMGRNDQHKIETEKQELAKQETARHEKPLTSESTTGGTSRQQAGGKKERWSKEPKDKGIALPQEEENEDITEGDQAPLKKAKVYYMTFKVIGQALGLKDLEDSSIPIPYDATREENIAKMVWKVLAGKGRKASRDKNASIRYPSVRYLHRLIVHTIFPRKEPGTVNDEELQLLHQTVQHYAHPSQLPLVNTDFYKNFGMVGFFVKRLIYYKEWAWTTSDSEPQIGIGGLITPLLKFKDITLEDDPTGPAFMDELCSFDIEEEHLLGPHGPLGPMRSPKRKKTADRCDVFQENTSGLNSKLLYGPPRYHFEQRPGALPNGPLRQAHEHIGNLQSYLKKAQYFSGRFEGTCVYSYLQSTKEVEVLLPNWDLTRLTRPGAISFDIGEEHLLGPHGPLGPMRSPKRKKTADRCDVFQENTSGLNSELLYELRHGLCDAGCCTRSHREGEARRHHDAGCSDAGSLTRVVEEKSSMGHAGTTTRDAVPARVISMRSDVLTRVEARKFPYPRCQSEVVDEVTWDERR
ncbi:hypothetical protein F2Q70_00029063 [Brassica cretica]|uniref:Arabidopsis retrotransposon Orf1 C-terminal domain-containing protein n=1 Tax=Brassica cretica TaxID=69181 RepID=A0A8S9FCY1_BRACR|nr:hypothetical protein F2Q70_00029063 [Brassica cretica]